MSDWFTIEHIDENTHIISEYRHSERVHSYLLCGEKQSLLIDTGLGIANIYNEVVKLTDKPVIAVATHIHWDHIGGHKYFPNFYVHEDELSWLMGEFHFTAEQIKSSVMDGDLPKDFDIDNYKLFQGTPTRVLKDNDVIDIGSRKIKVLHTPGHSPGHMCFYEEDKGYLFAGDLIYMGMLYAHFPSTDPVAYLLSLNRLSTLPIKSVFPAHNDWNVPQSIISDIKNAFHELNAQGKLHHGSGIFSYGYFSVHL